MTEKAWESRTIKKQIHAAAGSLMMARTVKDPVERVRLIHKALDSLRRAGHNIDDPWWKRGGEIDRHRQMKALARRETEE